MPNDPEFEFYYERLSEFDSLASSTKSKTFQDVIQIARDSTESSLEKFARLQRMTLVILSAKKITTDKQFEQYALQVRQASNDLSTGKFSSIDQYSAFIDSVMAKGNRDKAIYDLSLKVYTLAVDELKRLLIDQIYKPNNTSFHYESILQGLQYLAGKVFPGLEQLKAIRRFAPAVRKKEFAKTGDKLLLYIEQYADVLEKWNDFADAYIDILEN